MGACALGRRTLLALTAAALLGLTGPGAAQNAAGPRLGTYKVIYAASGSYLQNLVLQSPDKYAVYHVTGALEGSGEYRFDAATGSIKWLSGPFQATGYGGTFTTENDGRVHRIRLTQRAYAINGN